MKIKKLLKSFLFEIEAIRVVSEKDIYTSHTSDETFLLNEFPELYMNFKVQKFYVEFYELDGKRHCILNIKI